MGVDLGVRARVNRAGAVAARLAAAATPEDVASEDGAHLAGPQTAHLTIEPSTSPGLDADESMSEFR